MTSNDIEVNEGYYRRDEKRKEEKRRGGRKEIRGA